MTGRQPEARQDAGDFEELAGYLHALANPRRLELLQQLRIPRSAGEIQLRPGRQESDGNPERAISRTAVDRHLGILRAIGVLTVRKGERDGRAVDEYLVQHARLFGVVEELRRLTQLRALDSTELEITAGDSRPTPPRRVSGAHVTLLSGPLEGRTVALTGPGPWTIGRASTTEIALDYDPYISSAHAVLHRVGSDGFEVEDLPTNRNGTLLNWRPLGRGARSRLETGDVLRAGRSMLLFHGGTGD